MLVVGGGPTGVEFAGELSDFVKKDLMRLDAERAADMRYSMYIHALLDQKCVFGSVCLSDMVANQKIMFSTLLSLHKLQNRDAWVYPKLSFIERLTA